MASDRADRGAEVEEAQELLPDQPRPARRWWPQVAALAALAAAAAVLYLARAGPAHAGPSLVRLAPEASPDALAGMIQSRAVAERGRALTDDELVKVKGLVGKVPSRLINLDQRRVQDVSDECKEALVKFAQDVFGRMFPLALDALAECAKNVERDECKEAEQALEDFEDALTDECKDTGNFCTLTEKTPDGDEEEHACVPEECHGHEDMIAEAATEELQREPGCSEECTAEVSCGD